MRGYTLTDSGDVACTMSPDDYELLVLALGFATGAAIKNNPPFVESLMGLTNRLNEGNRNFTPYELPDAKGKTA